MAEDYLIRFLDDDNVAQDIAIVEDPAGDNHLSFAARHWLIPDYQTIVGVAVDATETIYQHTVSGTPMRVRKIVATGSTDGFFKLYIDGSVVALGKITPTERTWREDFGGGVLFVPVGSVLRLDIKNTGVVSSDYESIIYKGA